MGEKKYHFLKLKDDFFNRKEIKKLRRIAGGDTYTIIYLKMQLLSLKTDGVLYFEGLEDTFADELALEIDEEAENIKVTIIYLQKYGLIEAVNTEQFLLPETVKSIGSETAVAARVRRHREKEKALHCNGIVTIGNGSVTNRNTDIDIEIDKEIDIEIDIEKDIHTDNAAATDRTPYKEIIKLFHSLCPSLPQVQKLSNARKRAITARFKECSGDIREFEDLFIKTEQSDFLTGRAKDWQASFDWLMKPINFAKVLEGNYDNRSKPSNSGKIDDDFERMIQEYDRQQSNNSCQNGINKLPWL